MQDVNLLYVALAAFLGGIVAALLGWAKDGGAFAWRRFLQSAIFALLSAVGVATAYQGDQISVRDLMMAFMAGAGVDNISNRAMGVFGR